MPYERVMGMQVDDAAGYAEYRAAMMPLLQRCGGRFRYDFWIRDVLISETDPPINRVFIIQFPDRAANDRFFADPEYQAIRQKFFAPAVSAVTLLSESGV